MIFFGGGGDRDEDEGKGHGETHSKTHLPFAYSFHLERAGERKGGKGKRLYKGRGKNGLFKLLGSLHSAKDSQKSLLFGCLFVYLSVFKVSNHSKSIITQSSTAPKKIAPPPRPP